MMVMCGEKEIKFENFSRIANVKNKKEEPHRTAQPPTLAVFLPWGSSEGAGRMALGGQKYNIFWYSKLFSKMLLQKN